MVWPLQVQMVDPLTQLRRVCENSLCVIKLRFHFNCTFHENTLSRHVWSGFRLEVCELNFSENLREGAYMRKTSDVAGMAFLAKKKIGGKFGLKMA